MTNDQTESLLSRFAAAAEKLKGTGAPGLPEWCWLLDNGQIAEHPYTGPAPWHQDDGPDSVDNPSACLAGCVMWAMEVAWGYAANKNAKIHFEVGYHGCHSWRLLAPDSSILIDGQTNEGVETAWLMFVESLPDAIRAEIGRGK